MVQQETPKSAGEQQKPPLHTTIQDWRNGTRLNLAGSRSQCNTSELQKKAYVREADQLNSLPLPNTRLSCMWSCFWITTFPDQVIPPTLLKQAVSTLKPECSITAVPLEWLWTASTMSWAVCPGAGTAQAPKILVSKQNRLKEQFYISLKDTTLFSLG